VSLVEKRWNLKQNKTLKINGKELLPIGIKLGVVGAKSCLVPSISCGPPQAGTTAYSNPCFYHASLLYLPFSLF